MSATFLRRIIEGLLALCTLGGAFAIGRAVIDWTQGRFGTVRWPVQWDRAVSSTPLPGGSELTVSRGELVVAGAPFAQLVEVAAQLATLGLAVVMLLALRRVLMLVGGGMPFTSEAVAAIRRIGYAILGICAVSVLHVTIVTQIVLRTIALPEGMALHAPLSWNVEGMRNVWMDYDVPLMALVLAMLTLLVAEAFRIGLAYREDSESMV